MHSIPSFQSVGCQRASSRRLQRPCGRLFGAGVHGAVSGGGFFRSSAETHSIGRLEVRARRCGSGEVVCTQRKLALSNPDADVSLIHVHMFEIVVHTGQRFFSPPPHSLCYFDVYDVQGPALDSIVRNTLSLLHARVCLRDEISFDVITRERRVAYRAENGAVRTMWLRALKVWFFCLSIQSTAKMRTTLWINSDLVYRRNMNAKL